MNHSWVVTEGELRLTVEGVAYDLSPGGFVYVPVGASHTFANPTSQRAAMASGTSSVYRPVITSVYANRGDGWKLVLHQQTPLETP